MTNMENTNNKNIDNKKQTVEADIRIDGITNRGEGVGRLQGMAVFVPGAILGEKVSVGNIVVKKNYARASLRRILEPSPHRIMADCPNFDRCGGCTMQHMDKEEQLRMKQYLVEAAVRRIGKSEAPVYPVKAGKKDFYYRERMTYHVLQTPDRAELGFYMNNSRIFVPASVCMLPQESIRACAKALPVLLAHDCRGLQHVVLRCNNEGKLLLILVGEKLQVNEGLGDKLIKARPELLAVWSCSGKATAGIYGDDWQLLAGEAVFHDNIAGVDLELAPASFTQVNREQTAVLYETAAQVGEFLPGDRVLDLYCGAGAISLYLADKVAHITGVESYAPAVEDAARNAGINGITNCRFIAGKTEEVLPVLAQQGETFDVAVLDPPRAGCDKAALSALIQIAPRRIVYISCDPATLSRDINILSQGGYETRYVQPVDMFPQTPHVETVCLLSRKAQ